jgi:cobalt-zinc-cadmium efflux system membrane fusion protein
MSKSSLLPVLALGLLGLQCQRDDAPPVSYNAPAVSPELDEHADTEEPDGTVHLPEDTHDLVGIKLAQVKTEETRSVLEAMGKVLAPRPQKAIVGHAFSARVAKVHVKLGDWVKKEQPLVTLDSHEVGVAKTDFFKAIADLELAKLNLEREQRLVEGGIGVKKNLVAAEAQHAIAEANHEAAEKRLHVLGFTEEQVKEITGTHQIHPSITLYAPIDGKVVTIEAVLGALIDETTEIMTIIDPTLLWIDAEAYERDIAKVAVGQDVEITVPAYPGETFHGQLVYIGDVVDEETRTITVRAEVKNDDFRLKPGMFADVTIIVERNPQTVVVPDHAVLDEGRQSIVFIKHDDAFVRREVVAGPVHGTNCQIVSGLSAGEIVVIEGNHLLKSKLHEHLLQHGHQHGHQHGQRQGHGRQLRQRRRGQ